MTFNIGTKLYYNETPQEDILAMQNACIDNNWSLEDGTDNGGYYYIIRENIVVVDIDDVKIRKINELKQRRDIEEQTPISYSGYRWDFDDKAIQRINGAIIALGENGTITWTSADDEEIRDVNAEDLRGVISASAIRSNALHIKYRLLRERIELAETLEEVEAIKWEEEEGL